MNACGAVAQQGLAFDQDVREIVTPCAIAASQLRGGGDIRAGTEKIEAEGGIERVCDGSCEQGWPARGVGEGIGGENVFGEVGETVVVRVGKRPALFQRHAGEGLRLPLRETLRSAHGADLAVAHRDGGSDRDLGRGVGEVLTEVARAIRRRGIVLRVGVFKVESVAAPRDG